ncbi:SDR family NAD(P)-dependent oxidoreductase [Mycobacterium sp.]|uniref:SDR family NAD(P)-dependent oxidoreductase n=1 Tax=Mycobacterium sp. TaxID=1785 RepID=UPI003D0F0091
MNDTEPLEGKAALVTGSTSGIGRAIAQMFAARGASVVVTGRDAERGADVVATIRSAGGIGHFVAADLRNEDEVCRLVEAAAQQLGHLDVLVNNAAPTGTGADDYVTELRTEDLELAIRIGLYAPLWCAKYAVPHMLRAGRGSIVSISSTAAIRGFHRRPAYSAAKAGLDALTRVLAVDYGRRGIRANSITVGWVRSSAIVKQALSDPAIGAAVHRLLLTPQIGEVDDIANVALFLASDASRYVNGSCIAAEGGTTSWLDFGGDTLEASVDGLTERRAARIGEQGARSRSAPVPRGVAFEAGP